METNPGTRLGVLETWIFGLKKRIADRTSVSGAHTHGRFRFPILATYVEKSPSKCKKNRIAAQSFLHFPVSHG